MERCPNCGNYMSSHLEKTWDGAMIIWSCVCGYTNKKDMQTTYSNKTNMLKNN